MDASTLEIRAHNYKTENRAHVQILDLAICWLTLFFSSMQLIVTGRVAELDPVPKAVIRALKVQMINQRSQNVYRYSPAHVEDEDERVGARDCKIDDRENNETVD